MYKIKIRLFFDVVAYNSAIKIEKAGAKGKQVQKGKKGE
jgi:hypothetical protein